MEKFVAEIQKFAKNADKTGWTYVIVPAAVAQKLNQESKKSFRVKGFLDKYPIAQIAIMPMGEGEYILALNAQMRKGISNKIGEDLQLQLEIDKDPIEIDDDLLACIEEEELALKHFNDLTPSHRNYFSKHVSSAKTPETKAKRIAQTINALMKGWTYPEMLRGQKN